MDERDPVADSKSVYRRIHGTFLEATLPIVIRLAAVRPNRNDTTGISVFRASLVQPQNTLAPLDAAKVKDYCIARLAVRDLRGLRLTVRPDPLPGGPAGHALIPELSWDAYHADKERWKPVLVEMARLASADMVYPSGP